MCQLEKTNNADGGGGISEGEREREVQRWLTLTFVSRINMFGMLVTYHQLLAM